MSVLKAGTRLKSAVCDTEIMVIKASGGDHDLRCGAVPMLAMSAARDPTLRLVDAPAGGSQVGKRYATADEAIEILCTKGGAGSLALNGTPLAVKQAKALPSSD
jgi:hypothetical protein